MFQLFFFANKVELDIKYKRNKSVPIFFAWRSYRPVE